MSVISFRTGPELEELLDRYLDLANSGQSALRLPDGLERPISRGMLARFATLEYVAIHLHLLAFASSDEVGKEAQPPIPQK